MSIQELSSKFKAIFHNTEHQLSALIIVVALVSFGLGRASDMPLTSIDAQGTYENAVAENGNSATANTISSANESESATPANEQPAGGYVVSKNGTKYHLPWCPGAKQIKEENKIFFATKDEAERAGYTPAANCKGI